MIDRQLIICGTGRSGTTIFVKLIGCHPAIWAFRWESQLLSGVPGLSALVESDFAPARVEQFRELTLTRLFRRTVKSRAGDYEAGLFAIVDLPSLTAHLDRFTARVQASTDIDERLHACADFGNAIFSPAAEAQGATMWCEKTPRNLIEADVIARIYPQAKFINVVRDGRDVISSVLARKFWPVARSSRYPQTFGFHGDVTFEKAARYWTTLLDIAQAHEAAIGPERWLNVRFEDLSLPTDDTFVRIFEFLELEFNAAVVSAMRGQINPRATQRDRWRRDLSEEQAAQLLTICEPNLVRYGYLPA